MVVGIGFRNFAIFFQIFDLYSVNFVLSESFYSQCSVALDCNHYDHVVVYIPF